MARCLAGHDSAATDYCDLCGIRMDGPAMTSATPAGDELTMDQSSSGAAQACPRCGAPEPGRFCESCGHAAGPSPSPGPIAAADFPPGVPEAGGDDYTTPQVSGWTAVVTASRSHYDAVMASAGPGADDVVFPDHYPKRTFALVGSQMRIGRRSASKEMAPEIDLSGPPADPGISRLHAILVCQPDGTWAVVDPGSENGTTVNNAEITPGQQVLLRHGDFIHIGAWTSIAISGGG